MLRALILLAVLAGPAVAQSINPTLAGVRSCGLRRSGINHDQALTVAINENMDLDRQPVMVMRGGTSVSLDVVDLARFVRLCK